MNQAAAKPLAKALHTVTVVTKLALTLRTYPQHRDIEHSPSHLTAQALRVLGYAFEESNPVALACQKAVDAAMTRQYRDAAATQVGTPEPAVEVNHPVYVLHTDPGHGWLEVSIAELNRLNITDKISRHSYTRGSLAFLEEDMDYGTFHDAKRIAGERFELKEVHVGHDHVIRTYESYPRPETAHERANGLDRQQRRESGEQDFEDRAAGL